MTRLRTALAVLLGACLPAGLIVGIYATDWRHAAAGFVLGLAGLVVGTAPAARPPAEPPEACSHMGPTTGDGPIRLMCGLPSGHTGSHEAMGYQWGELDTHMESPWPSREDL